MVEIELFITKKLWWFWTRFRK